VQPSSTSYTFGPPGWSVALTDKNLNGVDFLAVSGTTVGGRVTDKNGIGLPGVTVTCKGKGFSSSTSTSSEGYYGFPAMTSGTYTIKAVQSRVKFLPGSRKVKLGTSSLTTNNFVAK
jgi:protocatechuate 3,4-dioxygenase beta subunit